MTRQYTVKKPTRTSARKSRRRQRNTVISKSKSKGRDMTFLKGSNHCGKREGLDCKYLTEGAEGQIHACEIGGGKFILKTFKNLRFYDNELEIINKIPKSIGAKFITHWACENKGYMIFDKWDGSLNDLYVESLFSPEIPRPKREDIITAIQPQLDTLHDMGLFHNDLHMGNILYKRIGNGKYEYTLTDFGQTDTHEKPNKRDKLMFEKLLRELK